MIYKESEIVELKASFSDWKKIIVSLSAFANKRGGTVIVGIDDKGEPLHMQLGKSTIEDFVNKIKSNTDPVLYPSLNIKTFGLGEIVEITIPSSDYKPVFAFGQAWERVGKSNIKLSVQKIRELVLRFEQKPFDKQPFNNTNILYDVEWVKKLQQKGFSKPNHPTIGEYLCLCTKNELYPQAIVKAARFKGTQPVNFIDAREFNEGLLSITDLLLDFIKKNIRLKYVISGKAERNEQWEYPMVALREIILNALVHRDYLDAGNIQVRIFDDSLEIWSPGLLPKELAIDTLWKNNRSIPRNKEILQVFHQAGEIENWGTGFYRILDACKVNKNPAPIFEERAGAFVTVLKPVLEKNVEKNVEKILLLLTQNSSITQKELQEKTGLSRRGVEYNIKILKDKGLLIRHGSAKGGYWQILT